MCGIAGIWAADHGRALGQAVNRMTMAMYHRGPDDGGMETIETQSGCLVLGARRLAIQDLSKAGHQPMQDPETGNWLVFNGEVYNFRALREDLKAVGVRFRSGTDTEVLLGAYRLWGLEAIGRLRGMFAFALWDAHRQRLLLARDPVGVKPLYYAELDNGFAFASEVRALLASGLMPRRLSREGLLSYLALGAVQEPHTMVESVRALPSAHLGLRSNGQFELRQYWSLRQCFEPNGRVAKDVDGVAGEIRSTLASAVSLRLISDAPVGVFLSGGLDSSTITALAAQQSAQPIRTVSVVLEERAFSEESFIDLVTQRYGTQHTEIRLTHQGFAYLLPDAIAAMDQPTFDGVNTYVVSQQARKAGLTVVLSGIGGDELFGGYPSFGRAPGLKAMRQWIPSRLRRPLAALVRSAAGDTDRARKLSRWVRADGDLDGHGASLARELFGPTDRQRLAKEGSPAHLLEEMNEELTGLDDFNSISYFELSHYLRNVLLRDTDVMGMAHSLELREPLLDQHLIELVASLPGPIKQSGPGPKPLLVRAMREDLPPQILHRTKMGFTFPFAEWLRRTLRHSVEETLLDPGLGGLVGQALDSTAVKHVWQRFLAGSSSWVRPWSLYVLKQWAARL